MGQLFNQMILSMFPISSRETSGLISLQNCAQFHMWQFRQDLFVSWGKNPHESDFLGNVSRENWIWLNNVWLVNKDHFFRKVRNVSSNIQYDSTRSSFVVTLIPIRKLPLTSNPNVGGFGQGDAEIVLQDPLRVQGLLVFLASVILAQIFLVLKKKQFEKVQLAEMNF